MTAPGAQREPMPRVVWVGRYEFPVQIVPLDSPKLRAVADEDCGHGLTGFIDGDRGIWLADNLEPRLLLEIVLHEITHAINHCLDVEDGADEEDLATKQGAGWAQFWLDNPMFLKWVVATTRLVRKVQNRGGYDA